MSTNKGFIKDIQGNKLLPITRAELVLDSNGKIALTSEQFAAGVNGNQWGLISADERKLLTNNNGEGISGLTTKLQYINQGLYVNNNQLNFYTIGENDQITSTPVIISNSDNILVTASENKILFALKEIFESEQNITGFIKSVKIDKTGRVISITGENLTNEDIPKTISNKTLEEIIIKNSKLDESVTDNSDDLSIVNKSYLISKLQQYQGIATGALKFKGNINSSTEAESYCKLENNNFYYKISNNFTISQNYIHDASSNVSVKSGDTLIVYERNSEVKYVYIPSGDETTTTLTIKNGNNETNSLLGSIKLDFSEIFNIINESGSNTVNINLQKVDNDHDGYLSHEDYIKFQSYAAKTITYTPTLTSGYEIGKLNLGDSNEVSIYGKDTISSLTLNNGTNNVNPYFTFISGDQNSTFTFEGINGIKITKKTDSDNIQIQAMNESEEGNNYLTITNGYQFKINKGESDTNGNITKQGITDYKEFNDFKNASIAAHALAIHYEKLDYSLTDSTKEYYYGSDSLKTAITI